jgi:acetylornithine deacetylase/succinyl-diaminopimelate desuccinylase-like protein
MAFSLKTMSLPLLVAIAAATPAQTWAGGLHVGGDDHDTHVPSPAASLQTAQVPAAASDPSAAGVLDEATLKSLTAAPLPKQVNPVVTSKVDALAASAPMKRAMGLLKAEEQRFIQESIQISEIPAPTFQEEARGKAFAAMLKANGLSDVRIDSIGNVIAVRKGVATGPKVAIIAHLDTVFDIKTNVKVRKEGSVLFGPGLTDNSNALAMMLSWLRVLNETKMQTVGDLVFVGSVGEEGNGDLRGVKQFFKDNTDISGVVILEGAIPPPAIAIMNTGTNRFQVDFRGPGGHSYGAFGQVPSAIHAQGRFIAKVADLKVPAMPKTTFTVGIVKGGRSVNTIAPDASLEIDIRSNGNTELVDTTKQVMRFVDEAVAEENKRWGVKSLSVSIKQIGARPGGMTSPEQAIVQTWMAAANAQGIKPKLLAGASTDAGVPIALGIPSIVMGCGGKTGGFHALDENWDPTDTYKGVQLSFLTTMSLAGIQGISQPTLSVR